MTIPQTKQILNQLRQKGVLFDEGLSDIEITEIQKKFDVNFPPDLKRLLQIQLPISGSFINWRQGLFDKTIEESIVDMLGWPLEGILWDIQNGAWLSIWGEMPGNYEDRFATAKSCYSHVPKVVPVYGHRYIPSEPNEIGNPVFSIHQTDIIYYGYDLATYFACEFDFRLNGSFQRIDKPNRQIDFWSWCVDNLHPMFEK